VIKNLFVPNIISSSISNASLFPNIIITIYVGLLSLVFDLHSTPCFIYVPLLRHFSGNKNFDDYIISAFRCEYFRSFYSFDFGIINNSPKVVYYFYMTNDVVFILVMRFKLQLYEPFILKTST
jgi:hypothetical protein